MLPFTSVLATAVPSPHHTTAVVRLTPRHTAVSSVVDSTLSTELYTSLSVKGVVVQCVPKHVTVLRQILQDARRVCNVR